MKRKIHDNDDDNDDDCDNDELLAKRKVLYALLVQSLITAYGFA